MNQEDILKYFKDENSPVGLLRYRWYEGYGFNTLPRTRNFKEGTEIPIQYKLCFWTMGLGVLDSNRDYQRNRKDYPREAVIYGDVTKVVGYREQLKPKSVKTGDILTNGNDEEAGFLAYMHSANGGCRSLSSIYTFVAPSERIDNFASQVRKDPRLVHKVLSSVDPIWIKGLHRADDWGQDMKINGRILISPYDNWQTYLEKFGPEFLWVGKDYSLFEKCITEGTQTYELEPEIRELLARPRTPEEQKEHRHLKAYQTDPDQPLERRR